jgi:hypothetical protein
MYKYSFDGFDWTELINKWNVHIPDDIYQLKSKWADDWVWAEEFLTLVLYKYNQRVIKYIANDIRSYCKAMVDNYPDMVSVPEIWKAFCDIEDDEEVVRYFKPLIGYAWI